MKELKNCPFCNGKAYKKEIVDQDPPTFHTSVAIACEKCSAQSGRRYNYGMYMDSDLNYAIELWNIRKGTDND